MNLSNLILIGIIVLLVVLLASIPFLVIYRRSNSRKKPAKQVGTHQTSLLPSQQTLSTRPTEERAARGADLEPDAVRLEEKEDLAAHVDGLSRKNGRPH